MNRKTPAIDVDIADLATLDMMRPAAEQIFATLKSAILDTTLTPGRMISENEVGLLFGASRTPVREAFSLLREAGLLITLPSRGTYVSKLSVHEIRGAQFVREALEVAVIERVAEQGISEEHKTSLNDALERQSKALQNDDKLEFQTNDDLFHSILADATGFERVGSLLIREKAILDRLRVLSLSDQAQMSQLLDEHRSIYDALIRGRTEDAKNLMRTHLQQVLKTLSGLIEANRDFFE